MTAISGRVRLSAFALFTLLALLFYSDRLLLGPHAPIRIHDTFDCCVIEQSLRGHLLSEYGLFGWYPHHAGGAPSFANNTVPYYIGAVTAVFLPTWVIYSLQLFLLMGLAGFGMYKTLRDFFALPERLALLGGIIFALNTQTQSNPLVPLYFNYLFPIYFALSYDLISPGYTLRQKLLRAGAIVTLFWLSYPVLTAPYFFPLQALLLIFWGLTRENFWRRFFLSLFMSLGYGLLFVPQIYQLFTYIPLAQRKYHNTEYSTLTAAILDYGRLFFGVGEHSFFKLPFYASKLGVLGWILLGISRLGSTPSLRKYFYFCLGPIALTTLFESKMFYYIAHTLLGKMDLWNAVFLNPFVMTLFAVVALSKYSLRPPQNRVLALGLVIALLALLNITGVISFTENVFNVTILLLGAVYSQIFSAAHCAKESWLTKNRRSAMAIAMVTALMVFAIVQAKYKHTSDLATFYSKVLEAHPLLATIAEQNKGEAYRVGSVDLLAPLALSYGFETFGDRDPLFNKYYKELAKKVVAPLKARGQIDWFPIWEDISLGNRWSYNMRPGRRFDPKRVSDWNIPLLEMMNVRYLFSRYPIDAMTTVATFVGKQKGTGLALQPNDHRLFDKTRNMTIYVYELNQWFERIFMVNRLRLFDTPEQTLDAMAKASVHDFRTALYAVKGDAQQEKNWPADTKKAAKAQKAGVTITRYEPDRIQFTASTDNPAFLVITTNFDPGWRATIDGRPVPIFRANHAFMGLRLDKPGIFEGELSYATPRTWWLHFASLLGLLLLISCPFINRFFAPKNGLTEAPWSLRIPPLPPKQWWGIGLIGLIIPAVVIGWLWETGRLFTDSDHFYMHKGPLYISDTGFYVMFALVVVGVLATIYSYRVMHALTHAEDDEG